jgi:HSP20 family protein
MDRLRKEMDRVFNQMPNRTWAGTSGYPAMNIWTSEDSALVTAELPGCNPDDLDISVVNETLTVTGSRQPEEVDENTTYHRRERSCGRFSRTFQLPFLVDASQVEAVFEKGILKITLPRAEEDKPKKIAIKSG